MRNGLARLFDLFFRSEDFRQVKKAVQTNRLLKGIVTLIWTTICLFLDFEREFESENLLGFKEPSICGSTFKRRHPEQHQNDNKMGKQFKLKTERRISRLISPTVMTPMDKQLKMFTPIGDGETTFAHSINFATGFCGQSRQ
jgi:hypothetical protein